VFILISLCFIFVWGNLFSFLGSRITIWSKPLHATRRACFAVFSQCNVFSCTKCWNFRRMDCSAQTPLCSSSCPQP
jgi:hypothetical protein